jgi:ketosteroid isomerase-like protein
MNPMDPTREFLDATMPRYTAAETAIHNGDPNARIAMWSRTEPLTLFGAARTARGWADVASVFDWLADSMSNCTSYRNEVLAAEASGDLAYTVAIEHSSASIDGTPHQYALRVTTVFRREGGDWKIVHRHGDRLQPNGQLAPAVGQVHKTELAANG